MRFADGSGGFGWLADDGRVHSTLCTAARATDKYFAGTVWFARGNDDAETETPVEELLGDPGLCTAAEGLDNTRLTSLTNAASCCMSRVVVADGEGKVTVNGTCR